MEISVKIISWTIPYFGNNHIMPYGVLQVSDGVTTKNCKTKGDKWDDTDGYEYINFKRKRYKVINIGEFYSPKIKLKLVN
jgi:hypothetical protein